MRRKTRRNLGVHTAHVPFQRHSNSLFMLSDYIRFELRRATMCSPKFAQDACEPSIRRFVSFSICDTEETFAGTASRMHVAKMNLLRYSYLHILLEFAAFLR